MIKAKAFWLQGEGRGVILEEPLASPLPGWCVLKTLFSAISPGTERLVSRGKVPVELSEEMRCPYMGGAFPFPVKYGYSLVGRVVESPGAAEWVGRIVHVLHPHQDYCLVRREDATLLPAAVPAERATLASNLETAVNAIWDSEISMGERALVVGFGVIGSLVARLLQYFPGLEIEIAERDDDKSILAENMGFRTTAAAKPSSRSFDLAFDAGGSPEGLQLAIDSVRFEGRVITLSWFGTELVPLALGGSFHSQRKALTSSQVSAVSSRMRSGWDKRRRKGLVIRLLEKAELDRHVTHSFSFNQLPAVFADFENLAGRGLSVLIRY